MREKFRKMRIGKRLTMGYVIVIAIMILSGILSIVGLSGLYGTFNSYVNGAQKADTAVKNCRINVNIAARSVREMALSKDPSTYGEYRNKVDKVLSEMQAGLDDLDASGVVDKALCDKYEKNLNEWASAAYSIMSDIENGDTEQATERILTECSPALEKVVLIAKEIDEATNQVKNEAIQKSKVVAVTISVLILLFVVGATVLSAIISKMIIRSIVNPIQEIEDAALGLSRGDLHTELTYQSDDEMGELADSMRDTISTLNLYVGGIARAMKEFSDGNFAVEAQIDWKGDFVEIVDSILSFEKSMSETVRGIQTIASQVSGATEQVAASANDLAEGATEQAGVTQQLTSTLATVSEQVRMNAENAKDVSQRVGSVASELGESNQKMHEMVDSMNNISETSLEISKIIATIKDIAAQTNLLALNASIEAARAGEAGRGFAVVADQVSILASQSAEAAKESTGLIEASVKAVEEGRAIAYETAEKLENVVQGTHMITNEVDEIAEALAAQSNSFHQINKGVDNINDVVQTNSATSEECAASSEEMSSQADTLKKLIDRFQIVS